MMAYGIASQQAESTETHYLNTLLQFAPLPIPDILFFQTGKTAKEWLDTAILTHEHIKAAQPFITYVYFNKKGVAI